MAWRKFTQAPAATTGARTSEVVSAPAPAAVDSAFSAADSRRCAAVGRSASPTTGAMKTAWGFVRTASASSAARRRGASGAGSDKGAEGGQREQRIRVPQHS